MRPARGAQPEAETEIDQVSSGVVQLPTGAPVGLVRSSTQRRYQTSSVLLFGSDLVALGLAMALAKTPKASGLAFLLGTLVAMYVLDGYHPRLSLDVMADVPTAVRAGGISLLVLSLPLAHSAQLPRMVQQAPLSVLIVLFGRIATYKLIRWGRARGMFSERALVLGAGCVGAQLGELLISHPCLGLELVGFVDHPTDRPLPGPLLGEISELGQVLDANPVDRVLVAFSLTQEADLVGVLRTAMLHNVDLYVVPRFFDLGVDEAFPNADELGGLPLCRARPAAVRAKGWPLKRAADLLVAGLALLLTGPLLGVIALAVRMTSPGPVLFRQTRVSQHGRTFELLKFRSMWVNTDAETQWSVLGDHRQTPVGRFLRKTSLDELPQLWNILKGDMSLVGPRPERPHFVEKFSSGISGYTDRHRVPAGLTGWAQIHGLRGPNSSIAERARLDNHYIEHWSLWRDFLILLRTFRSLFRGSRS